MQETKKGITIKQAIAIFALSASAPLVRLLPGFVANTSNEAAWLTPLAVIIFGLITIIILNKLINGFKGKENNRVTIKNLDDVFVQTYGKIIGKALCIIYIIWMLIGFALQVRVFAERFVITLIIYAPVEFFVITMLLTLYIMSNIRIEAFGRFSQLFLPLIFVALSIILISISSQIDIKNFLPVTIFDAKKIFLGGLEIVGVCSFFTFIFFFGDKIVDKENLNKNRGYAIGLVIFISLIAIICTVGVFGYKVTYVFSQPFFMALKSIKVFETIERIESIFIAFWVVADVTLAKFLLLSTTNLCKNTFNLSSKKVTIIPILLISFIVIFLLGKSYINLIRLSSDFIVPSNIFFGLVIPFVTLIIAKCRKLI